MSTRSLRAAALALSWCVCATGAAVAQTAAPAPGSTPVPGSTAPSGSTPPLGSAPPPGSTPGAGSEPAPTRPARGKGSLFGADDTASHARSRVLDLTVSASSAYDDDLSEGLNATALQKPVGGAFSDLTAALLVSRNVQHSHIGVRATNS